MAATFVITAALVFGAATAQAQAHKAIPPLGYSYDKWVSEDVVYIASDEEKTAFRKLTRDDERDEFIKNFWLRRDPTPGTEKNELKEEHYRRIAYSNQHFAAKVPGWKTDRGRIYIVYGAPEWIKDEPSSRPDVPAAQLWHYNSIAGAAEDMNAKGEVTIRFTDSCRCNDYKIASPLIKD